MRRGATIERCRPWTRPASAFGILTLLIFGCTEAPPAPRVARTIGAVRSSLAPGKAPVAFDFTTIDPPGSISTWPMGIGPRSDVVGFYTDAGGVTHGFLFSRGTYTVIDYPGAARTEVHGIGSSGEIVGAYRDAGEPSVNYHGFLRHSDGTFESVHYPGHTSTLPQRILPDGTILGCYHDGDLGASMRGVIMDRRGNQASDLFASMYDGATPSLRRITGRYTDPATGESRGFLIDDGAFTPLMVPGSSLTQAWDMNPAGVIAGLYRDGVGFHGFVLAGNTYNPVDVPGAAHTRVFGIDPAGDVVGSYDAGTQTHGFIATAQE